MRMSASSSTMRISLAMPCSSFHSRHLVVVVRLPAASVGHFFAQREDEADDRAATFPVAQNQIAAVVLPDLLHTCQAKSIDPLRSVQPTPQLQSLIGTSCAVSCLNIIFSTIS